MSTSPAERPRGAVPRGAVPRGDVAGLLVPIGIGLAVALALGVYGRVHEPSGYAIEVGWIDDALSAKVYLTTLAFLLAIVQVVTAAGMWGRLGLGDAAWTAPVHRWSGRLAVLATVPVVVHCLYALGFQSESPRVLIHSVLGCLFFGAFVTKMLALPRPDLPGWALPVLGGLVTVLLVALWLTSSLWFFANYGFTH